MTDAYGIYLHFPFCRTRCSYCSFHTFAGREAWIPGYVESLCAEITSTGQAWQKKNGEKLVIDSVYFGGGSPSLMAPQATGKILDAIQADFALDLVAEITLESNPADLDLEKLQGYRACGVNRLSIGFQSTDDAELAMLGRRHTFQDAVSAFKMASEAGFHNLGIDLIYGLPAQTQSTWEASLHRVLNLRPSHLSLYALSLEPGTPLERRVENHHIPSPDDDLAADMYQVASQTLARNGYTQYELSNWALREPGDDLQPVNACRHNLRVWRHQPYLGFGAGAHGYLPGLRYTVQPDVRRYMQQAHQAPLHYPPFSPAVDQLERLEADTELIEDLILGLRLTGMGVDRRQFYQRHRKTLDELYASILPGLIDHGWIEDDGQRIRLTPRAYLLANQILCQFIQ